MKRSAAQQQAKLDNNNYFSLEVEAVMHKQMIHPFSKKTFILITSHRKTKQKQTKEMQADIQQIRTYNL